MFFLSHHTMVFEVCKLSSPNILQNGRGLKFLIIGISSIVKYDLTKFVKYKVFHVNLDLVPFLS